jgi:Flp pilus assembly protein TadD
MLHEIRGANPTYTIPEPEFSNWAWSLANDSARLAAFRALVEMHPRSSGAHSDLGDSYLAVGDTVRAVHAFERALELNAASTYARNMIQRLKSNTPLSAAALCFLHYAVSRNAATEPAERLARLCCQHAASD